MPIDDILRRGLRQRFERAANVLRRSNAKRVVAYVELPDGSVAFETKASPLEIDGEPVPRPPLYLTNTRPEGDALEPIREGEPSRQAFVSDVVDVEPSSAVVHLDCVGIAAEIERGMDELVETTARDAELAVAYFIHDSAKRNAVLAEPVLAEVVEASERCRAGLLLKKYAPISDGVLADVSGVPRLAAIGVPKGFSAEQVAEWAAQGLRRLSPERRPRTMWIPASEERPGDRVRDWSRAQPELSIEREADLADHVLYLARRENFLAHPVVAHPDSPEHGWHLTGALLAWLHRAENAAHIEARDLLAKAAKAGQPLASNVRALRLLREAIEHRLPQAHAALGLPLTLHELRSKEAETSGIYPIDERLAQYLESMGLDGGAGDAVAQVVRSRAVDRKTPPALDWIDPAFLARRLAPALWDGEVRPTLEKIAARPDAPGLASAVLTNMLSVSARGTQLTLDGNHAEILDAKGRRIGSINLEIQSPHLRHDQLSLTVFAKISTQKFVRWFLHRTFNQKWIEEIPNASTVYVEGGYPELARTLGMKGKKSEDDLREAVEAFRAFSVNTPTGEGQVLGAWLHRSAPGKRAVLELTAMGPFAPDYIVRELKDAASVSPNAKQLVPVPLPQHLPPFVGRTNEYGAQAHLQLLALREFRTNAPEFVETGAVEVSEKRWRALLDEAGVLKRLLPEILETYPKGDGERPAFLERDGDKFSLAAAYETERRSIQVAGESMLSGKRRGKLAAKKRRGDTRKG